ncbi:Piso0_002487 [Millerozyma farinosa CBS 7064]|uniref:Piso0_002487 protein n=1 Tax=Pichia sorbitophila (strain ATCC MYA-4447 / BCRC 22081 / CBS 7064 / NBRC 10061 / NRRL Y-12695) TaxID=559304 RepID=G8YF64_PICSO|nr:Piso0_002487 [Millerozyma farinosa CBS 7064]
MVVHNPNNWHWIDKNCLPWSKEYFSKEIVDTEFQNDELILVVNGIDSVSGDCDVTQRKGKVLCIYDMKLSLSVSGTKKKDSETFSGSIHVPELVHDQDEDEYVFNIDASEHASEIRKHLVPKIKAKLLKFQEDLITAHSKDVQHATD